MNSKRLGLAGLVLALKGISVLSPNNVSAQDVENVRIESESASPQIIATFEYDSHRKGYEGKSPFLTYHLWSDNTISREGSNAKFAQKWFWDVDGDGKIGDAEINAIKSGKLIYMHPEFSKIANEKTREIFEYLISEKEKEQKKIEPQKIEKIPDKEKQKGKVDWDLATGINWNYKFDSFSGSLGFRVNPFKNKEIGLGALLDIGFGLDKEVDSYHDVITDRLSTSGTISNTNAFSTGLSLETQLGPFIIGGGLDYCNWVNKTTAQILKDNKVTKSNTDSTPNRQVFGKGYLGIEVKPKKNWKLGLIFGYHGKESFYFGLRNNFRLNK